ncbi:MAG: RagB/SusD family nutrient uptake outer membrane protein [Bacteroidetes bacterium]|nr:MAG: RagB/SusD family nutrient uptake outer membrane protein [Bacteroidota bacterium]
MKNLIFTITVLLFATACSDILEENPKAVALETFYNTADEIQSAVYAIYNPIRTAVGTNGGTWVVNASQVDYAVGRLSYVNMSDFQVLSSTNISRTDAIWTYLYQAIRNANLVIKNAPKSSKATQDQINQFVAEAKFLRAFCYFYMVRNWAGLPIRTEDNMTVPDVARSTEDVVYALILSDLEYAETNLPESQSQVGRANKYAAKAVLTHVYLQIGRWSDARTKALEIINSGKFSLIKVSIPNDFYKIFGPDVISSLEEIFYLKYNSVSGNYIARFSHHPSHPEYYNSTGVYALYADSVSNKFISDWDYKDLRKKFTLYNCNIGFGPTTMLFKKFIDPTSTDQQCKNDWPAYRYPDILLFYAEADCMVNNGPTVDGMGKLNMIHRRAYGMDPTVASSIDFNAANYTKDTFLNLVLKEKGYEQMDEGKRYFELKRTGKLKEAVKYARGVDVVDAALLWPIPSVEYNYNKAIDPVKDQNPGYK